jgi:hypothetical protein
VSCSSSDLGGDSRSASLAATDVAALRQELAQINTTNQRLMATIRSQQNTIQRLQARNPSRLRATEHAETLLQHMQAMQQGLAE